MNDHEALKKEQEGYVDIPVIRMVDNTIIQRNYVQIKQDVEDIINAEMQRMLNNPGLINLIIKKVEEASK